MQCTAYHDDRQSRITLPHLLCRPTSPMSLGYDAARHVHEHTKLRSAMVQCLSFHRELSEEGTAFRKRFFLQVNPCPGNGFFATFAGKWG